MELLEQFGINWGLLLAQAVNFFILLVILKKFAYGPIIEMLRSRREEIQEGIRMSAESKEKFEKMKQYEEAKMNEVHKKSLAMLVETEEKAKKRGEEMLQETQKKSEQMVAEGKKLVMMAREKMSAEVEKNAEDLVRFSLMKVLGKMDSSEKDKVLIGDAVQELKKMRA